MKRILPIVILGILVISGLGAFAIKSDNEIPILIENENNKSNSAAYTHTVFVEVGTATWCPSCPGSNTAWHSIYGLGSYDFEYTEMVIDKNTVANTRMNDYNLYWVPTSYFDGGQFVEPGTDQNIFKSNLNNCGSRSVPDLDAELNAQWLGDAKISIDLSIINSDNNDYNGKLRVYIIEKTSTLWKDYNGNWYYHAFLDFAWNQVINIDSDEIFEDSKVWDGKAVGFSNIQQDNIQIILAVFDDESHQAYSDPYHDGDDPTWAPFLAYYVDETVAVEFVPPSKPTITGPTTGDINVEYPFTFKSTDDEGKDVYFWIDWGDETNNDWVGPYTSGSNVVINHIYDDAGIYEITAKAKDVNNLESDWSNPYIFTVGNLAPNKPTISGPASGKIKISYEYIFKAYDQNGDNLLYYITWGDGNTEEWIGPYESNTEVKLSHSWNKQGTWVIDVKVKDPDGLESQSASLAVSIPKARQSFDLLFMKIFERYPMLNRLIENLFNN